MAATVSLLPFSSPYRTTLRDTTVSAATASADALGRVTRRASFTNDIISNIIEGRNSNTSSASGSTATNNNANDNTDSNINANNNNDVNSSESGSGNDNDHEDSPRNALMDFVGPTIWVALHTLAFQYPDVPSAAEKSAAQNYVKSIATLLPCGACRTHYSQLLTSYPANVSSRAAFSKWTVDAHNHVNDRLGKPRVSYDDAIEMYSRFDELSCTASTSAIPNSATPTATSSSLYPLGPLFDNSRVVGSAVAMIAPTSYALGVVGTPQVVAAFQGNSMFAAANRYHVAIAVALLAVLVAGVILFVTLVISTRRARDSASSNFAQSLSPPYSLVSSPSSAPAIPVPLTYQQERGIALPYTYA